MKRRSRILAGWLVLAVLVIEADAGQWPQALGPARNGIAPGEAIRVDWLAGGPATIWQRDVGSGFAGLAVVGNTGVLYHRVGAEDIVEAIETATGKPLWKARFPAAYSPSYTDDDGPRVVPLVDRGQVYTYGALGELRCFDLTSGKLIWERKTFDQFHSKRYFGGEPPEGYFGIGTSPILVGEKLIVNIGGAEKEAGVVAFDRANGKTLWQATGERASYSSPILATVAGVDHLIIATRLNLLSLDPETGAVRFQFPFGRSGPTVTAANPVIVNGNVFITASYGIGSMMVKIAGSSGEVLWRDPDILASQYTTAILHEGNLFGIDGRQDGPAADLKCFDPFTRTVRWTEPAFGYATLLKADGKLLAMKTDGTLVAIEPSADGYRELARAKLLDGTVRALPALAGGRLFARDTRVLKCVDLRRGE